MARRAADLPMRSQLVAPVLARVAESGGDVAAIIGRFGLPATAASDAEVVLPLRTLHDFLDAAEIVTRDPWLGLHVADRMPRGAYGVLEFSCRSAPTIREAFVRIARYVGLLNELVSVTFDEASGTVEQRVAQDPLAVGRHGNEFFVATLLLRARQLSGVHLVPERAWFAHPRPADVSELVRLAGTEQLRFAAGANGIALSPALLELPLATSDPPLLQLLDGQAQQSLAGRAGPNRLLGLVRQRIREGLGETPPTLASLAAALKMSPRTLQRRLADEGVSFQDLVEEVRHELALDYVRDRRRPLGEVAFLLGYAELRPFLRAFKRWTGQTPGEYRRVQAPFLASPVTPIPPRS